MFNAMLADVQNLERNDDNALDDFKRAQCNAFATAHGVENAESVPNKEQLTLAIRQKMGLK